MTDTPASWIIIDAEGRALRETYSASFAKDVNEKAASGWSRCRAIPAAEYLASLNKEPKE